MLTWPWVAAPAPAMVTLCGSNTNRPAVPAGALVSILPVTEMAPRELASIFPPSPPSGPPRARSDPATVVSPLENTLIVPPLEDPSPLTFTTPPEATSVSTVEVSVTLPPEAEIKPSSVTVPPESRTLLPGASTRLPFTVT